ncbi:hypothetical protein GLA29479_2128 [Lysobacter antibioticus]|nr:hypothetical protein GLA29479_2128 [Lysobacter antibioticus]
MQLQLQLQLLLLLLHRLTATGAAAGYDAVAACAAPTLASVRGFDR